MQTNQSQIVFGVFKGMGDLLWAVPVIRAELDRGVAVHLLLFPGAAIFGFCSLLEIGERKDLLYLHSLPRGWRDVLRFLRELSDLSPETVWISPHAPIAASSWKIPLGLAIMCRFAWRGSRLIGASSERLSFLFDQSLPLDRTLPLRYREWSAYSLYRNGMLSSIPPTVQFSSEISERRRLRAAYDLRRNILQW